MKSIYLSLLTAFFFCNTSLGQDTTKKVVDKTIFVTGGAFGYVADLTNKPNPKICFIPTPSADNPYSINAWYNNCEEFTLRPQHQTLLAIR